MRKTRFLAMVVALATALVVLAGCGSSGDSNTTATSSPSKESSTPSAPAATSLPQTGTRVPDNLTAEQLRVLILAAAGTVEDEIYDYRQEGKGILLTYTLTKSLTMTTRNASNLSPPLNPTDKIDELTDPNGVQYWRVNDGPWKYDPEASLISTGFAFPDWVGLVDLPVGGQRTSSANGGSTTTVTGLDISQAPNMGQNRCWTLTVALSWQKTAPGSNPEQTAQVTLTACEPDFLVTSYTTQWAGSPATGGENYRYNTGEVPEVPTDVVEVHCTNVAPEDQLACMYK
jgi:hypothetical protein